MTVLHCHFQFDGVLIIVFLYHEFHFSVMRISTVKVLLISLYSHWPIQIQLLRKKSKLSFEAIYTYNKVYKLISNNY